MDLNVIKIIKIFEQGSSLTIDVCVLGGKLAAGCRMEEKEMEIRRVKRVLQRSRQILRVIAVEGRRGRTGTNLRDETINYRRNRICY